MKRKITTLICFFIFSLSLGSSPVFAGEQREQKIDRTPVVANYLEKLEVKCSFGIEEFEAMRAVLLETTPHLINPMPEKQAWLLPLKCKPYWNNFELIIQKLKKIDANADIE